jgi:hypothetical protein
MLDTKLQPYFTAGVDFNKPFPPISASRMVKPCSIPDRTPRISSSVFVGVLDTSVLDLSSTLGDFVRVPQDYSTVKLGKNCCRIVGISAKQKLYFRCRV